MYNHRIDKTAVLFVLCSLIVGIGIGVALVFLFTVKLKILPPCDFLITTGNCAKLLSPSDSPTPSPSPMQSGKIDEQINSRELITEFINADYRVLKVVRNPFAPYTLIVATRRSKNFTSDGRIDNDEYCGGLYTFASCFFFVEPQYVFKTDPHPRFIAEWKGTSGDGLNHDSIKFKDADTLEFNSSVGDAGAGLFISSELNLRTGVVKEISRKQTE